LNYQIVLADGAINNINAQTLLDLYWALKYGSTNFGIVTRMTTYLLTDVWAGTLILDITIPCRLHRDRKSLLSTLMKRSAGLGIASHSFCPGIWAFISTKVGSWERRKAMFMINYQVDEQQLF
jgi:hypothetical protein